MLTELVDPVLVEYHAALGAAEDEFSSHAPARKAIRGESAERLSDLLRPETVSAAWVAARERNVLRLCALRAVLPPFLASRSTEPDEELRELRRDEPAPGYARLLAVASDPGEKRTLFRTWSEQQERRAPLLRYRREVFDGASREIGADGTTDALWPVRADRADRGFAETFERVAVEPLDGKVADALREARSRGVWSEEPADRPARDGLILHGTRLPPTGPSRVLAELGRGLRVGRSGLAVPRIEPLARGVRSRLQGSLHERPLLLLVSPGGAADWWEALGLWGEALRRAFVARRCGAAAAYFGDPALDAAARVLFRRLVLSKEFLARSGIPASKELLSDLCLLDAVVPRREWAYLTSVLEDRGTASLEGLLHRAGSGPKMPDEDRVPLTGDPRPVAELRGLIWGLLLEERLLRRFGTSWFRDPRTLPVLAEIWEAEPENGVDSMAEALGLGTIEPTPVLDRCRP